MILLNDIVLIVSPRKKDRLKLIHRFNLENIQTRQVSDDDKAFTLMYYCCTYYPIKCIIYFTENLAVIKLVIKLLLSIIIEIAKQNTGKNKFSSGLASYVVWTSSQIEMKRLLEDIHTGINTAQDRVVTIGKKMSDKSTKNPKQKRSWAKVLNVYV